VCAGVAIITDPRANNLLRIHVLEWRDPMESQPRCFLLCAVVRRFRVVDAPTSGGGAMMARCQACCFGAVSRVHLCTSELLDPVWVSCITDITWE